MSTFWYRRRRLMLMMTLTVILTDFLSIIPSELFVPNWKRSIYSEAVNYCSFLWHSTEGLEGFYIESFIPVFECTSWSAFSALTLLVRRQEEHSACKNWVMRCWCGYLSGARCRLFAYGPANATASENPIISCLILSPDWFYLSGTGLPRLSWKSGH